jgi:hypothetical protein
MLPDHSPRREPVTPWGRSRREARSRRSPAGYKLVAQDATYLYLVDSGCCQSSLLKVIK